MKLANSADSLLHPSPAIRAQVSRSSCLISRTVRRGDGGEDAEAAGLADRVSFYVARATDYPGEGYALICFFDALHDMGDPIGVARYAGSVLAPGGTVMLIEPFANDRVEDNISPAARLYYAGSVSLCCANAIADGGHLVLRAQAGAARLAEVFREAGFTHFRRAAETPFNLILEARR